MDMRHLAVFVFVSLALTSPPYGASRSALAQSGVMINNPGPVSNPSRATQQPVPGAQQQVPGERNYTPSDRDGTPTPSVGGLVPGTGGVAPSASGSGAPLGGGSPGRQSEAQVGGQQSLGQGGASPQMLDEEGVSTERYGTGLPSLHPQQIFESIPILFLASLTLFSVSHILMVFSSSLLNVSYQTLSIFQNSISGVAGDEEHGVPLGESTSSAGEIEKQALEALTILGSKYVYRYYLIFIGYIVLYVSLNVVFRSSEPFALFWVTFLLFIVVWPNNIASVFLIMSVAPAVVATINFTLSGAWLAKSIRNTDSPSPVIGLVGAMVSIISFLGSLASIGKLLLDPKMAGISH